MSLAATTKLPIRTAMEARDHRAVVEAFAEDAVLRSPFTDSLVFQGRDQLEPLIAVILDTLQNLTYTDEIVGDDTAVLVGNACVSGTQLQFSDHLKLRDDGLIEEMTVFFRPLPATTAALRRIGEGLGRQRSGARGRLIKSLVAPLALMSRAGDRAGARLARP